MTPLARSRFVVMGAVVVMVASPDSWAVSAHAGMQANR